MNVLYLNTSSNTQEIKNLIVDITSNIESFGIHTFEVQHIDFRWYKLAEFLKIRRFLKENKIDIIHAYNYLDAYYALMISFGLNIKLVLSCYSNHNNLNHFSKKILKKTLSKIDAVIFQSEIQKNIFISRYKRFSLKFFKLFHGFSSERLDDYRFESIRDEYFIDGYRYLIGTLGDFSPEHDIMNILKMVKRLRRSGRNFTCLISGDIDDKYDSYFDECKYYYLIQGLDNYVTYTKKGNNTPNYLSQLDAFVYHSDDEAVALPVIEAMMMGVNVIVNDSEMIKEITHNGKYATIYKTNDAVDFAEKTRDILLNLDDYRIIAETVKEECRDIFSIKRHIFGLKEIYSHIKNY